MPEPILTICPSRKIMFYRAELLVLDEDDAPKYCAWLRLPDVDKDILVSREADHDGTPRTDYEYLAEHAVFGRIPHRSAEDRRLALGVWPKPGGFYLMVEVDECDLMVDRPKLVRFNHPLGEHLRLTLGHADLLSVVADDTTIDLDDWSFRELQRPAILMMLMHARAHIDALVADLTPVPELLEEVKSTSSADPSSLPDWPPMHPTDA